MPVKQSRVRGVQADKQNLTDTFEFGHMLLDISDGLSIAALWGALPLRIQLRSGQELVDWSGLMPPEGSVAANPLTAGQRKGAQKSKKKRAAYENDRTLDTRTSLVNLRIEAELLLFIGQTGMNRGQAHQLKIRHYSYKSAINGYEVRDYKHRRQGEVMFEIFSEYRTVFERYLAWRREVFPNDKQGLLFPLIRISRAEDEAPNFDRMRKTCKKLGIPFISPRHLRNTRVNWLLRRSRDSDVTADIAQHYKQALHQIYEEPSLQVAMTEVARFWLNSDPALPSPAPGVCDGVPVPMAGIPSKAPKPDCLRPSGCLWCDHHRDIDSQDYVWSLSCMRHLKSLALSGFRPPEGESTNDPAYHVQLTLDRLTTKLQWFKQSNELRHGWVAEAYLRIDEGDYHPHWGYLIESLGGD
jgi:integrase